MVKGDYVLATKYRDGDPQDQWAVGFYDHTIGDRHFVVGNDGNQLRANGFRRVETITHEQGDYLLQNARDIEMSGNSVWSFIQR